MLIMHFKSLNKYCKRSDLYWIIYTPLFQILKSIYNTFLMTSMTNPYLNGSKQRILPPTKPHAILISTGVQCSLLLFGPYGWLAIKSSWRTYLLNLVKFSRRSKPFTSVTSTPCHKSRLKCTLVGWEAHPYSFFKLNIDGLAQRNSRRTNASGVIRDHKGTWINDFSRSIGYTHSMIAQLWGICDGIDAPSVVGIIISDFSTLPPVVFCTSF